MAKAPTAGTGTGTSTATEEASLRKEAAKACNRRCVDCDQRGPTYVDLTVGSFVCSRCSGLLRGLTPPHRVKSISMATFTKEEIERVKNGGNDRCKATWLGLFEGQLPALKDEQTLKDHLSDVYEKKRYYLDANDADAVRSPSDDDRGCGDNNGNGAFVRKRAPDDAHALWVPPIDSEFSPHRRSKPIARPSHPMPNVFPGAAVAVRVPPCPTFPVDFSSADIYNSSQNDDPNKTRPPVFGSFDNGNAPGSRQIPQDRYAALADLDFEFRQQHHGQETVMFSPSVNPFDMNNSSADAISKNPFYSGQSTPNGNVYSRSNPFTMGPGAGHSKNPFL